jgi:hypothetical protein
MLVFVICLKVIQVDFTVTEMCCPMSRNYMIHVGVYVHLLEQRHVCALESEDASAITDMRSRYSIPCRSIALPWFVRCSKRSE